MNCIWILLLLFGCGNFGSNYACNNGCNQNTRNRCNDSCRNNGHANVCHHTCGCEELVENNCGCGECIQPRNNNCGCENERERDRDRDDDCDCKKSYNFPKYPVLKDCD